MSPLTGSAPDPLADSSSLSSDLSPRTVRTYHVFLASPGDVEDERNAIRDFFDRYNRNYAEPRSLRFEVVDWENYSSAGVGRPQELITKQTLERFRSSLALVIGIMAQRFGSPSGTHESGTEEEFEWAVDSWLESGFPEVKWFFRDIKQLVLDPEAPERGAAQWKKVQAFRKRMDDSEPRLYTRSYSDLPGFKELLDTDLGQWLNSPERPWFEAGTVPADQASPSDEPTLRRLAARLDDSFVEHMRSGDSLSARQARVRYIPLVFRLRKIPAGSHGSQPEGPLQDFLGTEQRLLVVGAGGGGKTTTLKHLATEAARSALADAQAPLPIYLRLNAFDSSQDGFDALLRLLSIAVGLEPKLLEERWRNGSRSLLFLLDGLNEVGRAYQQVCANALLTLMQSPHSGHRYIVTSRPGSELEQIAAHPTESSGLKVLDVLEFDASQVRRFLSAQGDSDTYDRISRHVEGLTSNPFLLWAVTRTLMLTPDGTAPRSRGGLFRDLIDHYIFQVREQGKPAPRPTRYNYELVKKPVLSGLALDMTEGGVTTASEDLVLWQTVLDRLRSLQRVYQGALELQPESFMPEGYAAAALLDEVVDNGVILREGGSLRFMHESVQEYFAACVLQDQSVETIAAWAPQLELGALDLRGRAFETIVTLAGLLSADRAGALTDALLPRNPLLAAHVGHEAALTSGSARRLWNHFIELTKSRHEARRSLGSRCLEVFPSERPEVVARLLELLDDAETRQAAGGALKSAVSAQTLQTLVEAVVSGSGEVHEDRRASILHDVAKQRPPEVAEALLAGWRHASTELRPRLEALGAYIDQGPRLPSSKPDGLMRMALLDIAVDAEVGGELERAAQADLLRSRIMETPLFPDLLEQIRADSEWFGERRRREEPLKDKYQRLTEPELANLLEIGSQLERRVALGELVSRKSPLAAEPMVELVLDTKTSGWMQNLTLLPLQAVSRVLSARAADATGEQATRARRLLALLSEHPSTDVLQQVLDEEDSEFRVLAARAAGRRGPSALPLLEGALRSEHAGPVIQAILTAIASWGKSPAHGALLDLLFYPVRRQGWPGHGTDDDSEVIRDEYGSQNLADTWAPRIHEALVGAQARGSTLKRVRTELGGDPVRRREAIVEARRWLPDGEALALLQRATEDGEVELRRLACWALACAGDTAGWRQLVVLELERPPDFVGFVQDVARRLNDPDRLDSATRGAYAAAASEVLRPALAAAEAQRRADALRIMGRLPDRWLDLSWRAEAITAAEDLLQEATGRPRATAAEALSRLAPNRERLVSMLNDEDPAVQEQARKSLGDDEAASALQEDLQRALTAGDAASARGIATTLPYSDREPAVHEASVWLARGQAQQRVAALLLLGNLWYYVESDERAAIVAQAHAFLKQSDGKHVWREYCRLAATYPKEERSIAVAILASFLGTENVDTLAALAAEAAPFWPDDPNPLWFGSLANLQRGDRKEAHSGFIQLFERFDKVINHAALATAFEELNEPVEALRLARRAVERDDEDSAAHFKVGWYAYVIGDIEASLDATKRGLELQPMEPMAHCNLALALLVKDQPESAWTEYRRAVAIARRSPSDKAQAVFEGALSDLDALTGVSEVSRPIFEQARALLRAEKQQISDEPRNDPTS